MDKEKLDISVVSKALNSFGEILEQYEQNNKDVVVRDACLKRFEYCYDLSSKIIKRYLSITSANPANIENMSFQDLIREAYKKGILKNSWDQWFEYRNNRNNTVHSYDESIAIRVAENLMVFYHELRFLLKSLQDSNET